MRLGIADAGSSEYLGQEPLLNQLKRVSINSGTERALAVVIVDANGATLSGERKYAVIDHATSGDNTIVAAVASKKIRVISGLIMAAAAVNVRFESGASGTALTGQMNLAANAGFIIPYDPGGNFETAAGSLLNLELSGAVSVDGWITYVEV